MMQNYVFLPGNINICMNHYRLKDMPEKDRPYEKCLKNGPGCLSDAELLAVILRTGAKGITSIEMAKEILSNADVRSSLPGLHNMTVSELCRIKGVGKVKAVQIQCITELSRRIAKSCAGDGISFNRPEMIADYYMEDFRHLKQEHIMLLMFDTKCHLLREQMIAKGTADRCSVSPREIFSEALVHHAVCVVLIHNHPSGDCSPSEEDSLFTKRIREAGEMLEITLLDHIILGDKCYFSYRENNMI